MTLAGLPLVALVALFAAAALIVWIAGAQLTAYVNAIANRTGLGKAFTGMLLLGGITSLPEVAAVSTSAAVGNAPLATNNLLGTASINLLLLAVADMIYGDKALTGVAATPATLMQGVLSMLLAALVAMVATAGDIAILGFGAGSATLALAAGASLWLTSSFERRHVWEVVDKERHVEPLGKRHFERHGRWDPDAHWPFRKLVAATTIVAAAILVGGFLLSISADALAARTGVEAGMVGFVLVGLSTSLPEISSITAAIRLREYDMAVGDIFGTNLFNFSLIFLADLIYAGDPLLSLGGAFEVMAAILAVLLTGVFLVGLLNRRSAAVLRMGYDSLTAIVVFGGGVFALSRIAE